MSSDKPLDPEAAAAIARVRKLMLVASLTTFVAVGAVLAVIGYRISHGQGSAPSHVGQMPVLPAGAHVVSSAVGDGHVVLTVEVNGVLELRSYDLVTLKPLARVRLTDAP